MQPQDANWAAPRDPDSVCPALKQRLAPKPTWVQGLPAAAAELTSTPSPVPSFPEAQARRWLFPHLAKGLSEPLNSKLVTAGWWASQTTAGTHPDLSHLARTLGARPGLPLLCLRA